MSGRHQHKDPYKFEPMDSNLSATKESEQSFVEDNLNLAEGKIDFAETDLPLLDPTDLSDLDYLSLVRKQLDMAEDYLMTSWKLAVSFTDPWTSDADKVASMTCKNLSKLFHLMLESPGMEEVLSLHHMNTSSAKNPRLFCVLSIFRKARDLIRFDTVNQHLMPVALKFTHHTLNMIQTSTTLQTIDPPLKTLLGCYTLMEDTEKLFDSVYRYEYLMY